MRPALVTLAALADIARASTGSENCIRQGEYLWSFDAHPRELANGALMGRVQRQRRGESSQDVGGYKIDAAGVLVEAPDGFLGLIPPKVEDIENIEPVQQEIAL